MLHDRQRNQTSEAHSTLHTMPDMAGAATLFPTVRSAGIIRWAFRSLPPFVFGLGAMAAVEIFAPADYKVSDAVGGYLGHETAVKMATEIPVLKAQIAAQNDAAIHAQQTVELFRSKTQQLIQGCQALFQRVGTLNQVIANTQEQYIAKRQDILSSTLSAKIALMNLNQVSPMYGAILGAMNGDRTQAERPEVSRQKILDEYDRAMQDGLEKAMANIRKWQPGIGKMAMVDNMVPTDCITTPVVAPETKAPPPPSRYDQSHR